MGDNHESMICIRALGCPSADAAAAASTVAMRGEAMARRVLSVTFFWFIWQVFRIRPLLVVDADLDLVVVVGSRRSVVRLSVSCTVLVAVVVRGGISFILLSMVSEGCNSRLGLRPILVSAALVSDICGSLSVNKTSAVTKDESPLDGSKECAPLVLVFPVT